MKHIYIAVFYFLFCTGCQKKETDFVGKYEVKYTDKVVVENSFTPLIQFTGYRPDGRIYYEICPLTLNLFKDEAEGKLKGEARIINYNARNYTLRKDVVKEKIDLSLVNFRLVSDTLEFTLENAETSLMGKKIKGQIFKDGDISIIGIETDAIGDQESKPKTLNYNRTIGEMTYFKMLKNNQENDKLFYEQAIAFMEEEKTPQDSIYFQNGVNFLKSRIK